MSTDRYNVAVAGSTQDHIAAARSINLPRLTSALPPPLVDRDQASRHRTYSCRTLRPLDSVPYLAGPVTTRRHFRPSRRNQK